MAGAREAAWKGVAGARGWLGAVEERTMTATTRRVPPQRGQVRTNVLQRPTVSTANGLGSRGARAGERLEGYRRKRWAEARTGLRVEGCRRPWPGW